jgi:NAD(P)-dependent dehydrogenase (short-subunit alcohol dehydrogenase family)
VKIDSNISAVVTGGASGLGRASAEALAAAGAKVAIFDINEAQGEEIAKPNWRHFLQGGYHQRRFGGRRFREGARCAWAGTHPGPLRDDRRGAARRCRSTRKRASYKRTSTEDYEFGVQGILVASYRLASLSALGMSELDPMEDGERGCITLTASVAAQDAQIGQVIYGSAKAGVNGLVLPLARDLMDLAFAAIRSCPAFSQRP